MYTSAPASTPRIQSQHSMFPVLAVALFSTIYLLAVVPVFAAWVNATAQPGQSPESFFLPGMVAMFVLAMVVFALFGKLVFDKKIDVSIELVASIILVVLLGSLCNLTRMWNSEELGALGAYEQAQENMHGAHVILGQSPALASQFANWNLETARARIEELREIAQADVSPATVSSALVQINFSNDQSPTAKFIRENAMVREQDAIYLARLSARR